MSRLRLSALALVALGGLAAIAFFSSSPEVGSERGAEGRSPIHSRARSSSASHASRRGHSASAPREVHPSTMLRFAREGHPVDPVAFREASALELIRIDLAPSWIDRLEEEERSCEGCRVALDAEARSAARSALSTYRETLAAVAGAALEGDDAMEAYRAARETLLSDLPPDAQAWLGWSGFLDSERALDSITPELRLDPHEMIAGSEGNTSDDPAMQGI